MKTRYLLPLVAGLALAAGFIPRSLGADLKTTDAANVTVTYQNPDIFTDVRENHSSENSTYYLDQLRGYLQKTAASQLAAGEKLQIWITDIDLAGENLFNQPYQIRVMKEIYSPRVKLRFQLVDAAGKVLKEGERHLNDTEYLMQAGRPGSNEPLFYDKELLRQWILSEFSPRS